MIDPNTGLELLKETPDLTDKTFTDTIPPVDRNDITNLNEDHLKKYIMSEFQNAISDKQDYGWTEKKEYAVRSYYGKKNEAMKHWPFENASAFPVPLTTTILDTAWANVQAGLFEKPSTPLKSLQSDLGVGIEDIRPGNILLKFLNWQLVQEIKIEAESDKNVFRAFLNGDGILKIIYDIKTNKVKIRSIDSENFYVPIDASGVQRGETDINIHIIPLSYSDVQLRKAMNVYREPDSILPGANLILKDSDQIRIALDEISGQSMNTKVRRDNYYIAEVDVLGYVPPDAYRSLDLKVWMSPNGGVIQRIRKIDKAMKLPYAVVHCYPYAGRFYSMGIPEKLRNVQEKIDYADKQYTDSIDVGSRPAMFIDETDSMLQEKRQRVRGGVYPKGRGNTIDWEPAPPIDRDSARERALLWEMAERLTGVIDITQGRASSFGGKTLGEVEIRTARADVRFSTIFRRFGRQIEDAAQIVYELNYMYVSKEKIIDVVGHIPEGYDIDEIFQTKNGELVNHNLMFSGQLQSNSKEDDLRKLKFLDSQITSPLVSNNAGNLFNISKEMAEINGIRDFSRFVRKPKDTRIVDVDEFIQRVISGDTSVKIRPGIDADDYTFEIMLFMRSQMYKGLEQLQKQILMDALRRAFVIGAAEREAKMKIRGMLPDPIEEENVNPEQNMRVI